MNPRHQTLSYKKVRGGEQEEGDLGADDEQLGGESALTTAPLNPQERENLYSTYDVGP